MTSRLDSSDALYAGMSSANCTKLQWVPNTLTRVVLKQRKFYHITPSLVELHWLPTRQQTWCGNMFMMGSNQSPCGIAFAETVAKLPVSIHQNKIRCRIFANSCHHLSFCHTPYAEVKVWGVSCYLKKIFEFYCMRVLAILGERK